MEHLKIPKNVKIDCQVGYSSRDQGLVPTCDQYTVGD